MHSSSLWQIALDTDPFFVMPVFSLLTTTFLINLPATGLVLTPSTDYLARVTFRDNLGNATTSLVVPFTTLATGTIPLPGLLAAASQGCGDC